METFARLTEAPAVSLMALHFLQLWSWPRQAGDAGAKPSSSFFLIDSRWNVQFQLIVCDLAGSDWNAAYFYSNIPRAGLLFSQ